MIQKLFHSHSKSSLCAGFFSVLFIGFSAQTTAEAQAVLGAREMAVGQANTAIPNSQWSVFANPAMIDSEQAVSFFGFRYAGFVEITDMALAVTSPVPWGVVGGGVHRYGFDLFNESRIRIAYKNEYEGFHFGLVANYSHVAQGGGYGSAGAVGIDVGIAANPFERLWLGARAVNVNRPRYAGIEELPRELSIGISYRLSDVALFVSDVVKDVRFPVSYRGGVEIAILEKLYARAGITTEPVTQNYGFGYSSGTVGVNVAVQYHMELGISPAVDLKIKW